MKQESQARMTIFVLALEVPMAGQQANTVGIEKWKNAKEVPDEIIQQSRKLTKTFITVILKFFSQCFRARNIEIYEGTKTAFQGENWTAF